MRSIWKGAISFGLVTVPVKLYSATEQRDVAFHQVHRKDGGRIHFKRVCGVCGEEVAYADIAKGYELPGGETVVLTDEDFAELPLMSSRRIEVLQFTPADQVDPIFFARSYYLEPEPTGTKSYVLLRDALERSGVVAIVKVALRQRESLGTLRPRNGVFVLETMLWPDEVRTPDFPFLDEEVEIRPQELKMAASLITEMTEDFAPERYHDAYREALQAVIDAKVAGREVVRPEGAYEPAAGAADLMSALRASVEAAKRNRAGQKVEPAVTARPAVESGPGAAEKETATAGGRGRAGGATRGSGSAARRPVAGKEPAKAGKEPAKKEPGEKEPAKKEPAKRRARKSA